MAVAEACAIGDRRWTGRGAAGEHVRSETEHQDRHQRDRAQGEPNSDDAFRGETLHGSIVCGVRFRRRRGLRGSAMEHGAAALSRRYHLAMTNDFAVEALGRCRLFGGLGTESRLAIARTLRTRRFRRGEVLFHEGDPGDALFIVASGAVKVVVPSEEGEEAILATLRRGDFLGELALLDGAPAIRQRRSRSSRPRRSPCRATSSWPWSPPSRRFATRCWLAGRRAAAADHPRRRAPLPRPDRPAGGAAGAPGRGARRARRRRHRSGWTRR